MNKGHGYPYITGGGGTLFSRAAVEEWKKLGCKCPAPDTPDDMMIGLCFHNGGVPLVHLNNFHQARPNDYRFITVLAVNLNTVILAKDTWTITLQFRSTSIGIATRSRFTLIGLALMT